MKILNKKVALLNVLFSLCYYMNFGQSPDQNYIVKTELLVPIIDAGLINTLGDGQKIDLIEYYDGLGRLIQTNNFHASPTYQDIVQHIEYDDAGRQKFDFLPFPNNADAEYLANAADLTTDYYDSPLDHTIPETTVPFGERDYDDSPLNRIMKQGFPGESWQLDAHPQQFNYLCNTSTDHVLLFEYNDETQQFMSDKNYEHYNLYVITTLDENGYFSRIFKDKLDRIVLQESYHPASALRTYYIYNIYGNLAVVIPPEGSRLITGSFTSTPEFIQRWCFTYKYDSRQRMVEKLVPGILQPVYFIYDALDRVILTQDGNQRSLNQWIFTKYDVLGRPIIEGFYRNSQYTSREDIQNLANDFISEHKYFESRNGSQHYFLGYTADYAFPPHVISEVLKVYYYDDYDFNYDVSHQPDFQYRVYSYLGDLQYWSNPKGLLTGTKVKILEDRGLPNPWLISVNFYDNKSRIIQQQNQNHYGGYDTITNQYYFIGDIKQIRYSHQAAVISEINKAQIIKERFTYDHFRRLKENYYKINDQDEFQMAALNYNELGQLIEKNLHQTGIVTYLQSLDYSYNIRGWLKGINLRNNGNDGGDVFFQQLVYDSAISVLNCSANYNGNIAANLWKQSGSYMGKGYGYSYDATGRLQKATYGENGGGPWSVNHAYSVPLIEYDQNGNITRLQRNFGGIGDDLYYYYEGNRIIGVDDHVASYFGFKDNGHNFLNSGTEYFYDENGNLTSDLNKGITNITYNHLNLPYKMEFENNRRIYYIYDANGTKLRKYYYEDNRLMETTDYSGMFVYKDYHIDYIQTSEGRMKWDDQHHLFYAEYFIKDHLGNVRSVVTSNPGQTLAIQGTDYYPFGLEIPVYGASDNQIKYNSKELQTEADLNWYDYGARFYDPVLARWHSVDPMAETSRRWSPYTYCMNNPIRFIDPDGMDTTVYVLDQANNPDNKRVYTADVYVDVDGKINGPYDGSSFPNDDSKDNTLKDGEYDYNNESGHKGGTQKGLNIVNEDGERKADGTDPEGNDVEMKVVNVHSGVSPEDDPSGLNRENRGSAGCPTIKPTDADTFFNNFNWNTSTGQNSNTGTSTGKIRISRDQTYNTNKKNYLQMIKRTQMNKGI